jgi:hypothetical protein
VTLGSDEVSRAKPRLQENTFGSRTTTSLISVGMSRMFNHSITIAGSLGLNTVGNVAPFSISRLVSGVLLESRMPT